MNTTTTSSHPLPQLNIDAGHILPSIRAFALDMDGTIYLGEKWIDGAREFLARIPETGRQYIFLTNNSSKDPLSYVEKLQRMGLEIPAERILTSGQAAIWYLQKNFSGKKVFLLGNDLLQREFLSAGIPLEDEHPDLVVVGFDTSLDYGKMCRVCDHVRAGIPYIATHPDYNCPTETGFIPDAGAIMAFIHASAFRWPDTIVGKPHTIISDYLMERLQVWFPETPLNKKEVAMVGDRLYTDIAAGVNAGLRSVLVLSGEASLEDARASETVPDLIFQSVKYMIPLL